MPHHPTKQIPVDLVRQVFREQEGRLYWLHRPVEHFATERHWKTWNTRFAGKEAGCILQLRSGARCTVILNTRKFLRNRLVWAYHHGYSPTILDHKNRNTLDDRVENLREASPCQNGVNSKNRKNNKSGFKGVYWDKKSQKWIARIRIKPERIELGRFTEASDAAAAYVAAAKKYHGEFACDGTEHCQTPEFMEARSLMDR